MNFQIMTKIASRHDVIVNLKPNEIEAVPTVNLSINVTLQFSFLFIPRHLFYRLL